MALTNFIKAGTYSRIERYDFSKHMRFCSATLTVYEDSSLERVILETQINISAGNKSVMIGEYVEDENLLLKANTVTTEPKLIKIKSPKSEFAKEVNYNVVFKDENGQIKFTRPSYIFDAVENSHLKRDKDGSYSSYSTIETEKEFEEFFKSGCDVPSMMYLYLKRLPEYSQCETA